MTPEEEWLAMHWHWEVHRGACKSYVAFGKTLNKREMYLLMYNGTLVSMKAELSYV